MKRNARVLLRRQPGAYRKFEEIILALARNPVRCFDNKGRYAPKQTGKDLIIMAKVMLEELYNS